MNREYLKGKRKRHDPSRKKTAPAKKITKSTAAIATETENKKKLSSKINYDALEKLFGPEGFTEKSKLDPPEAACDHNTDSEQNHDRAPCEPQGSENYHDEDVYGDEEYYGGMGFENEDEGDYYGYNDNLDDEEF